MALPLTRSGAAVTGAGIATIVLGLGLGYVEIAALGAALVGAVAIAVLASLGRTGLSVERSLTPERVSRGDAAVAQLTVQAASQRGSRRCQAVDSVGGERVTVELPPLRAGQHTSRTYLLPTQHRGLVPVGPLRVVRQDPFGLVRRERREGDAVTLVVRPRVLALTGVPGGRARSLDGTSSQDAPQGTVTFSALRDYVVGDDVRHIHWKASARRGEWVVRQYVDTSQARVAVVLDVTLGVDAELFEEAVDVVASVCAEVLRVGFPLDLRTSAGTQARPERELDTMLNHLALVARDASAPLRPRLDAVGSSRADAAVVVLARPLDGVDADALLRLRRRCPAVVLVLLGPHATSLVTGDIRVLRADDASGAAAAWIRAFSGGGEGITAVAA